MPLFLHHSFYSWTKILTSFSNYSSKIFEIWALFLSLLEFLEEEEEEGEEGDDRGKSGELHVDWVMQRTKRPRRRSGWAGSVGSEIAPTEASRRLDRFELCG